MNDHCKLPAKLMLLPAILGLLLTLGCSPEVPGVFLIVELENSQNIKQYSVFNPYSHSIEQCQSTAKAAIEQIFASNPMVIPKDSRVTGWRCSLLPPERGG